MIFMDFPACGLSPFECYHYMWSVLGLGTHQAWQQICDSPGLADTGEMHGINSLICINLVRSGD
jgi:hypothetical protein